jgi:hypothetical protein
LNQASESLYILYGSLWKLTCTYLVCCKTRSA